jgi:ribose transport system permease protein
VLIWVLFSVVTIFMLHRTRMGRYIYAVGNNPVASLLSGINVRGIGTATYIISGLGAALVGVLLAGYAGQSFLGMGNDYQLIPIAGVVIGGTNILGGAGSYAGTIAGALVVTLLDSILTILQVTQAIKYVIFGLALLFAVLIYGRGRKNSN